MDSPNYYNFNFNILNEYIISKKLYDILYYIIYGPF